MARQTIGSGRIILTELLDSEVSEEYLETLNDSEYMKYSRNSNFVHTLASQIQYVTNFRNSKNLLFGLKDTKSGQLLGSITCYVDFSKMTLNLGFLIFKNQQNKGYATEALGLLIPYLEVQYPGMTALIGSNKNNYAMHAVAEKLNFQINSAYCQDSDLNLSFIRKFSKLNSNDPPIIPDFILRSRKIGVAAYDAGGAEQISWLLGSLPQKVFAKIEGPALRIFSAGNLSFEEVDQLDDIMECDLIITGSGWMSQLELDAIKEARKRDITCVTILDHWVNYEERFGKEVASQPQVLAVTNSVALQLAQQKFPKSLVCLLPDLQIEHYRETLKQTKTTPDDVLIVLEPTSSVDSIFSISNKVLENLIASAVLIKAARGLRNIFVRPHPSQISNPKLLGELESLIRGFEISSDVSLLADLEHSAIVLGVNSYALYISAMAGCETYSFFAGVPGHWTNNFPSILEIDF